MYRLLKRSCGEWRPLKIDNSGTVDDFVWEDNEEDMKCLIHTIESDPDHAGERYTYEKISETQLNEINRRFAMIAAYNF